MKEVQISVGGRSSRDPAFSCSSSHTKQVECFRPVIDPGDLNCAYQDMDMHKPPIEKTCSKKREGKELNCNDMSKQKNKKFKIQSSDASTLFLETLSTLSDQKKLLIKKLGFASILEFSCFSNVDEIYFWLVSQFDINSDTITLDDGFSFTLTAHFIKVILGFPSGPKSVITETTGEVSDFILNIVQMESPTVEHLCSMLNNKLDECSFQVIFMLLMVTVFIDSNESGVANPAYYPNFIDVDEISHHDWCTFTLNCLLKSIKKYLFRRLQNIKTDAGGWKIILVISYFEFLITSEFNLGSKIPRLPLWRTNVVNSLIALDSHHGKQGFGRLSRKHISSTPFKGSKQKLELPPQIHDYMNLKLKSNSSPEDKKMLQLLVFNFFQKVVENSIPIVKGYIDDMLLLTSNDHEEKAISSDPEIFNLVRSDMIVKDEKKKFSAEDIQHFLENMFYFRNIEVPADNFSNDTKFQQILDQFSARCSVGDTTDNFNLPMIDPDNFNLPMIDPEFETKLIRQTVEKEPLVQIDQGVQFSDFLKQLKEEIVTEIINKRKANKLHLQDFKLYLDDIDDCKIPLETLENYLPQQQEHYLVNKEELNEKHYGSKEQKSQYIDFPHNKHTGIQSPTIKSVEHQRSRDPKWGLSLNERIMGRKIPPIILDNKEEFPSFKLMEEDSEITPDQNYSSPSSKLKAIDPLLHMVLDQCGKEFLGCQSTIKLNIPIGQSSKMQQSEVTVPKQIIFATSFEHEFYTKLTSLKQDTSPRIFQIRQVWVDQRTLTLSMNKGGWIHPCVMDCFGMLTTTDQIHRRKEGKFGQNEILIHVVIKEVTKLLMDPMLNCSDPEYKRIFCFDYVGFRLENAGLVHIPCPVDKQWILIVANFIDKSFDVLNPDNSIEKFSSVVNTVIFNFKQLFVQSYPGCFKFNIRDFSVKYVHVPKHIFRYDSGIFVIQYIRWYNGVEVKIFSNVDVQAIREKVTTQIVINLHNELQVPLARQFIAKHVPHLLH